MTMNTSITSNATDGQKTQYNRMMEDAAKHGAKLALDKIEADSVGWQRVLENGDELRTAIAEIIVAKTRELSFSNQYANEEVTSNYGYLSGYQKPIEITDQIDILRSHWPKLNPDGAIRYMREQLFLNPKLQLPSWVEGPFALIRPGFFSNLYGEELEEILKALTKARGGKFYNYRDGQLGPKYLRQNTRTVAMTNLIMEQQSGSDILIVPEQFGICHRGRSVRRAREVFVGNEFGEGAKNVGTMLITNPNRLKHYDDLYLDCPGDEYALVADGGFSSAPSFYFGAERVEFGAHWFGSVYGSCGSVSAFLPQ